MTMRFDPGNPSSYDAAELQHELTRFGPTRSDVRPPVIDLDRARDVVRVVETGRQLDRPRPLRAPGLDRRPDPATSLAWIGAFLCIVLAIAACGLAVITVQIARHWLGALELLTLGCIAGRFLRRHR